MNEYPFKKYNFVLFNQIGVKIIRLHVKVGSEVRVHEKICPYFWSTLMSNINLWLPLARLKGPSKQFTLLMLYFIRVQCREI